MGEVVEMPNRYDKRDIVRQEARMLAGALKIAAYRVRDLETNEWSELQFHMLWDNHVMALMGEESAKLFANFVLQTLSPPPSSDNVVVLDAPALAEKRAA